MTVRLARIERADGPKAAPLPKKAKAALEAKAPATARVKVEPIPRGGELDLDDFAVFVARLARACGGHGPAVMAAGRLASRVAALRRAGGSRAVSLRVMGAAVALVREIWRDPIILREPGVKSLTLPLMEDAPTHPGERPDGWECRLLACLFGDSPREKEAPRDETAADVGAQVPPHVHTVAAAPAPEGRGRAVRRTRATLDRLTAAAGLPTVPAPDGMEGYGCYFVEAVAEGVFAADGASAAVEAMLAHLRGHVVKLTVLPEDQF